MIFGFITSGLVHGQYVSDDDGMPALHLRPEALLKGKNSTGFSLLAVIADKLCGIVEISVMILELLVKRSFISYS